MLGFLWAGVYYTELCTISFYCQDVLDVCWQVSLLNLSPVLHRSISFSKHYIHDSKYFQYSFIPGFSSMIIWLALQCMQTSRFLGLLLVIVFYLGGQAICIAAQYKAYSIDLKHHTRPLYRVASQWTAILSLGQEPGVGGAFTSVHFFCHINGRYLVRGQTSGWHGIICYTCQGSNCSRKRRDMKTRPNHETI